jgi:probable HAF family extracellular repeat protein
MKGPMMLVPSRLVLTFCSALILSLAVTAQPLEQNVNEQSRLSFVDLGTLGGSASEARTINNRRQIVGRSETVAGLRPFLWARGEMIDVGSPDQRD